jgi:hypothetical protein
MFRGYVALENQLLNNDIPKKLCNKENHVRFYPDLRWRLISFSRCTIDDQMRTALHIACQEQGGDDRNTIIRKLAEMTDSKVLVDCNNKPEGVSPFMITMVAGNWSGLRVLIESRLVADLFVEVVKNWPDRLFYQFASPLATFLRCPGLWPGLTSDEKMDIVQHFVERGSCVNEQNMPPICCRGNTTETIRILVSVLRYFFIVTNKDILESFLFLFRTVNYSLECS